MNNQLRIRNSIEANLEQKTIGEDIYKLRRCGVVLQLEYWKNGTFIHIITGSVDHGKVKAIYKGIK